MLRTNELTEAREEKPEGRGSQRGQNGLSGFRHLRREGRKSQSEGDQRASEAKRPGDGSTRDQRASEAKPERGQARARETATSERGRPEAGSQSERGRKPEGERRGIVPRSLWLPASRHFPTLPLVDPSPLWSIRLPSCGPSPLASRFRMVSPRSPLSRSLAFRSLPLALGLARNVRPEVSEVCVYLGNPRSLVRSPLWREAGFPLTRPYAPSPLSGLSLWPLPLASPSGLWPLALRPSPLWLSPLWPRPYAPSVHHAESERGQDAPSVPRSTLVSLALSRSRPILPSSLASIASGVAFYAN
jgi:hypothetical protein